MIRTSRFADLYVGSVAVRVSPHCRCHTERGSCAAGPLHPDVVVTGKYVYHGPKDPTNQLASVEDQPPPHVMGDVRLCSAE